MTDPDQPLDAPSDRDRAAFVFDGDCGFCAGWARWLSDRADPTIDFEPFRPGPDGRCHGITATDIRAASYFIDERGRRHRGGAGFAAVLRRSRGPRSVLGLLGSLPVLRLLARVAYRLVARNRHRLPAPPPGC